MIREGAERSVGTHEGELEGAGERGPARRGVRLAPLWIGLVAVVSLALGVGLTTAFTAARGGQGQADQTSTATDLPLNEPRELPEVDGTAAPGRPADTPEAAVAAFLDAEAAGEYAKSYALLSATDRVQYRTPAGWVATHADVMPPVTGYDIEAAPTGDDARSTVVAVVGFEATLDQVVGLVPQRARATWVVDAEDGGWVVALDESSFEPLHPPEDEAVDAVRQWAESHRDCKPRGEHDLVLGAPALAQRLCDESAAVAVGDVETFVEGFDTNTFLAAYGESVLDWGRVVAVTAPVPLRAVVAPIGPDWRVIGVLQPVTEDRRQAPRPE